MNQEPKRPYLDRTEINRIKHMLKAAGESIGVLVRIGRNGLYVIKRPSDEVMGQIKKA